MDQLMQKLMISKAIMDKSDGIRRTDNSPGSLPNNRLENFDIPNAKYNIPQEYLQEQPSMNQPLLSSRPNTNPVGSPTVDAIKNSKLPDEIKRLMMEHPIAQAQQPQTTISNELIEKASRLMRENGNGSYVPESAKERSEPQAVQTNNSVIDYKLIGKMINDSVNKALKENGLLVESSEKANESFSFRVGKHLFEGKISKIKKLM